MAGTAKIPAIPAGVSSTGFRDIPKWQIAVAVGAPVAVGLGVWYWRRSKSQSSADRKGNDTKNGIDSPASSQSKSNLQKGLGDVVVPKELTPLDIAEEYKLKGNELYKAGNYADAVDNYSRAIAACPTDKKQELSTFFQNRAAAHEALKNMQEVIMDCNCALELNPRYIKALHRRAKVYEQTNDLARSLQDATAVCVLEQFQNHQSLILADRVMKNLGKSQAKIAIVDRASVMPSDYTIKAYFSAFSRDPVMDLVKKLKTTDDDSGFGSDCSSSEGFTKVIQDLNRGRYDSIIEDCTTEIEREFSNNPDVVIFKPEEDGPLPNGAETGEADSAVNGESDSLEAEAEEPAAVVVDEVKDDIQQQKENRNLAFLLRGTFYMLMGDSDKAMSDFIQVSHSISASSQCKINALIKMASVKMQSESPPEAFSYLSEAIDMDNTNADIFHHRGQLNLLLDNFKEAADDFAKAVALEPNFPIALVQKCYTDFRYASQERNFTLAEDAVKTFESTLNRFPNCVEGYTLFAQVLLEQQEFEKANECFDKGIDLDPNNPNLYVHKGLLLLQFKSDLNGAVELMKTAIRKDPKSEFAYETLGTVEVQRGNMEEGVKLFDMAIKFAKTEIELAHLFTLKDAAIAQAAVAKSFNIEMPRI